MSIGIRSLRFVSSLADVADVQFSRVKSHDVGACRLVKGKLANSARTGPNLSRLREKSQFDR